MATFGITDDQYSDYGARYFLGAAAVLGFGGLAGGAIIGLNNSAYLRALGKQWELKYDWKHSTGSMLSSGSAINKSALIKQSILDYENLGVPRNKREASIQKEYIRRAKEGGDVFFKKTLENQKRGAQKKFEQGLIIENSINQMKADIEEQGIRLKRNGTLFTDDLNKITTSGFSSKYKNLMGSLIDYNESKIKSIDSSDGTILNNDIRQKINNVLRKEQKNTLKGIDGEINRKHNYIKSIVKGLKEKQKAGKRIKLNAQGIPINNKILGVFDEIKEAKRIKKMVISSQKAQMEALTSDPTLIKNNGFKWLSNKLELNTSSENALEWTSKTGLPVVLDETKNLQLTNQVLKITQDLPEVLTGVRSTQTEAFDIISKIRGKMQFRNSSPSEVRRVEMALGELYSFAQGDKLVPQASDALKILRDSNIGMSGDLADFNEKILKLNKNLTEKTSTINQFQKTSQRTANATDIDKILKGDEARFARYGSDLTLNEYSRVLVAGPRNIVEDSLKEVQGAIVANTLDGDAQEYDSIKKALVNASSKLRKRTESVKLFDGIHKLPELPAHLRLETNRVTETNTWIRNNLTRSISSTGKQGDLKAFMPDAPDLGDGWKMFDINDNKSVADFVKGTKDQAAHLRRNTSSPAAKRLYQVLADVKEGATLDKFQRSLFVTLGLTNNGQYNGVENKFAKTLLGSADPALKKVADALKNATGSTKVDLATKIDADGNTLIKLLPNKGKTLDIKLPSQSSAFVFKQGRTYLSLGQATKISGSVEAKSGLKYVMDKVVDSIVNKKDALSTSIADVKKNDVYKQLQRAINGAVNSHFGPGGESGRLIDITDMSTSEAMKSLTLFDYVALKDRSSHDKIKGMEAKIAAYDTELAIDAKDKGNLLPFDRARKIQEKKDLMHALKKMRNGITEGRYVDDQLSRAPTFIMDGMTHSVSDLEYLTGGAWTLTTRGVPGEKIAHGRFMTGGFDNPWAVADSSRGMKVIYNRADTLDHLNIRMADEFNNYTMNNGLKLDFDEEMQVRSLLSSKRRRGADRNIMGRYRAENHIDSIKSEISYLETLKDIEKGYTRGNWKPRREDAEWFKKLTKYTKGMQQKKRWSGEQYKKVFDNLENKYKADQINKLERAIIKKKSTISMIHRLNDIADINPLANGLFGPEMIDPGERSQLDKLSKFLYGRTLGETVYDQNQGKNNTLTFLMADQKDELKNFGFIKYNKAGKEVANFADLYNVRQLKTFITDAPLVQEGMAIFSAKGAERMGKFVSSNEKSAFSLKIIEQKINAALKSVKAGKNKGEWARDLSFVRDFITTQIGEMDSVQEGKRVLGLSDLNKKLGKDFERFFKTMDDLLQSGNSDFLKNAGSKNMLVRKGQATAAFKGFKFVNGQVEIKYDFIQGLMTGNKVIGETTDKYITNMVLDNQDMLSFQRQQIITGMKSKYSGFSKSTSSALERLADRANGTGNLFASQKHWDELKDILSKGKHNTLLSVAEQYGENEVFDVVSTMKREQSVANKSINKGRLQNVMSDLLGTKIPGSKVSASSSKTAANMYTEVLQSVLDNSATGRDMAPEYKMAVQKTQKKANMMSDIIELKSGAKGPILEFKEKNLTNLYESLENFKDMQIGKNAGQEMTLFQTKTQKKIKEIVENKQYDELFVGGASRAKFAEKLMSKINVMMTLANDKGPFGFEGIIHNYWNTTQDPFELTSATTKGKFNVVSGYDRGLKINVYDAMMLKMSGRQYLGSQILENMKKGRGYVQNYLWTFLEMTGQDPSRYMTDPMMDVLSKRLGKEHAAGETLRKVLTLKAEAAEGSWNFRTGLKDKLSMEGLLNFGHGAEFDTKFLDKTLVTKGMLEGALDDDDVVERMIAMGTDNAEKMGDIKGVNAAMKEVVQDRLEEVNIRELLEGKSAKEQVKLLLHTSGRLRADQVQDYQALTRKYKKVAFGVDPYAPKFTLTMNKMRGRQIAGMSLQTFGFDTNYSEKFLAEIADGSRVDPYRDISLVSSGFIGESTSRTNFVHLNDAMRAQRALLTAVNAGASQEVIQSLADIRYIAQSNVAQKLAKDTLKKGLPGSVRSIGVASINFNYKKANVWSVLDKMSTFSEAGIQRLNIQSLSKEQATKLATEGIAKIKSAGNGRFGQLQSSITDMLEIGKQSFHAAPGQVIMSESIFREGLDSLGASGKDIDNLTKRMQINAGQKVFIGGDFRFPVLKEGNAIPANIQVFDHEIFDELKLDQLQPINAGGNAGRKLSEIYGRGGLNQGTYVVSQLDALRMGGDIDRDFFTALLGIDGKFGPGSDFQKENERILHKDYLTKNRVTTVDGTQMVITEKAGAGSRHVLDNIMASDGTGQDRFTKAYKKHIGNGLKRDVAIQKALAEANVTKAAIETSEMSFNKPVNQYVFSGRDKHLLMDDQIIKKFGNLNEGKFTSQLDEVWGSNKRLQSAVMNASKVGNVAYSDELTKIVTSAYNDKLDPMKVDALLGTAHKNLKEELSVVRRRMINNGSSAQEIDDLIGSIKHAWAERDPDRIMDAFKNGSANDILNASITRKFREQLPAISGTTQAVKTLTGEMYNTGKYVLGNMAMMVYGDNTKAAREIMDWAGDLSQTNISAKHKIPLITSSIISNVDTIINPSSTEGNVMRAVHALKTGSLNAEVSHMEVKDIFDTNKQILRNIDRIKTDDLLGKANQISSFSNAIRETGNLNVKDYTQYLKNVKSLVGADDVIASQLGANPEYIREIESAIKSTSKATKLAANMNFNLGEKRLDLQLMMKEVGASSFKQMATADKVWLTNRATNASAFAGAINTTVNKSITPISNAIADIFFDKRATNILSNNAKSIFHGESVSRSVSRRIGDRIKHKVENSRLRTAIDAKSFSGMSGGGILGIAAIGFIGAFAIASSRRDWLGPTMGTGGEYAERHKGKNEERLKSMDIHQRLNAKGVSNGALRFGRPNSARIQGTGINKRHGPSMGEMIGELAAGGNMPEQMGFHRFN